MSKYDSYFLMSVEDAAEYVKEKLPSFQKGAVLSCQEIGDGNLNYVFRVKDARTGTSIIVKQAGEETRISREMKLSTDRGRIESRILRLQAQSAPGMVPAVYLYDGVMCTMLMEDMDGHTMMRTGLMNHEIYPLFGEQITDFLVNSLLDSTDVVMDHKAKKERVREFINPDLCEISENLVYSEPYVDYNHRNNIFLPNADFIEKEIYEDKELRLEAAKLKFEFMNHAQALIHGDLHTGSVFINQEHLFVFDPEFAFYGPMGYDVGNIIANLFFAWCNGDAVIESEGEREKFCGWVLQTIGEIVDKFIVKFKEAFMKRVTDLMAKTEGFLDYYLDSVLSDTAAAAGLESIRRIVGMANVKDITAISNEGKRVRAERIILTLAKDYVKNRSSFKCGKDYLEAIERAVSRFR